MDVVVTLPQDRYEDWIGEGDLPGEPWNGDIEWDFYLPGFTRPAILPGERVYVVCRQRLIGYAPLVRVAAEEHFSDRGHRYHTYSLVRHNDAVAVTVPDLRIPGFRGFRYRVDALGSRPPALFLSWPRSAEVPFPEWNRLPAISGRRS